jgi:hemerythrin-like metal-binding protein
MDQRWKPLANLSSRVTLDSDPPPDSDGSMFPPAARVGALFQVGVPKIDAQHARLLALHKDLLEMIRADQDAKIIRAGWVELYNYVDFHFAEEEKFMQSIRYPGLAAHRELHLKFAAKVSTRYRQTRSSEREAMNLLMLVEDWIDEHLRHEDIKYVLFLRDQSRSGEYRLPTPSTEAITEPLEREPPTVRRAN